MRKQEICGERVFEEMTCDFEKLRETRITPQNWSRGSQGEKVGGVVRETMLRGGGPRVQSGEREMERSKGIKERGEETRGGAKVFSSHRAAVRGRVAVSREVMALRV